MKLGNGHVSEVWARAPFKAAAFAAMCMLACMAYGDGATFKLKTGIITDWTNEASYVEGSVPSANDIVEIQDRSTGIVYSTDIESCRLVASLAKIKLSGNNLRSCIVFDIGEGKALTNECSIMGGSSGSSSLGGIIKRGRGEVVLNSSGVKDYYVNRIRVEEGVLRGSLKVVKGTISFGNIYIAEGAEFHLPLFDWTTPSGTMYFDSVTLTGAGDLYYDETGNHTSIQYRITDVCEFSGTLHGKQMQPFFQGRVMLTGESTDVVNNMKAAANYGNLTAPGAKGVVGVKKIGMKGNVSSLGKGSFETGSRGGGFLYLGDSDDTTDRELIATTENPDGPTFFDAGHHGGITFTGDWRLSGSNPDMSGHFVIMGSNTVPCVLANNIYGWKNTSSGNSYSIHLQKKGIGTWRLADCVSRTWKGALTVDEGRIQFDSIAETNVLCSLGYATILTEPYRKKYTNAFDVAWAHRLGSTNSTGNLVEGELEYIGASPGISSTRQTVLAGTGRIDAAGTGSLYMKGVSGYGTGSRTLVLDGASCTTNLLLDIVDSNACVSVVKEGAGKWTIGGELDFSGDLMVKGGTLAIRDDSVMPYSWFRFSVKQLYKSGDANQSIIMQDLALYDNDGRRQNVGLAYDWPDPYPTNLTVYCLGDYLTTLAPGGVAFADKSGYDCFRYNATAFTQGRLSDVSRLFDDISSGNQTPFNGYRRVNSSGSSAVIVPNVNNPSTWFRLVMRLTNGTPAIVSYDISRGSGSSGEKPGHPVYFGIEGSHDGFIWDELHAATPEDDHSEDTTATDTNPGAYRWMSDGTAFAKASTLRPGLGYRLSRTHRELASRPLAKVRKISVSGGATLVTDASIAISNLVLDATSSCTIDGFTFPADSSATLDVRNLPATSSPVILPCTFTNVRDLANLNGWTFTAGGASVPGKRLRVVGDKVVIMPKGITLSFR